MKRFAHPLRQKYNATAERAKLHARRDVYIAHRGGQCERCSCTLTRGRAEFHHPDPSTKDKPAKQLFYHSLVIMREELDKLEMLCSSCHRDIHDEWDKRDRQDHNEQEAEALFNEAYNHYKKETETFLK